MTKGPSCMFGPGELSVQLYLNVTALETLVGTVYINLGIV